MEIEDFNAEQAAGIEKIRDWYAGWADRSHRKQVFFLTGGAGTGKTSLAKAAAARCVAAHNVVYIAPTGKAASRLRAKGCTGAMTIHSFVYNPRGEDENGDPIFVDKGVLDSRPLLIVLDEASMVGDYDMHTILQHNIPVLALGDLNQLDPVKASPFLTPDHVDHRLTQIMRQAETSNIIRAANFAKEGKRLPLREYEDVRVRQGTVPLQELLEHAGEDAQILCSYNNTRHELNARIRKAKGFTGDIPNVGEKVMCTFNQRSYNFYNGEQGIVLAYEQMDDANTSYSDDDDDLWMVRLKSLSTNREIRVKFNPLSFSRDEETKKEALKMVGGFDYGFVCTTHKAQGSEWPRVLLVEEPMGNTAKLFYTAYTRAMDQLTIYRR